MLLNHSTTTKINALCSIIHCDHKAVAIAKLIHAIPSLKMFRVVKRMFDCSEIVENNRFNSGDRSIKGISFGQLEPSESFLHLLRRVERENRVDAILHEFRKQRVLEHCRKTTHEWVIARKMACQ
jgi:hypothetical protein